MFKIFLKIVLILQIVVLGFFYLINKAQANYYVAPYGNDNSKGTFDSPWKSIQFAINKVKSGDVINVRGGVYKESIIISEKKAFNEQWITIKNYLNEIPIIDAESIDPLTSNLVGFKIINSEGIRIKGFEIRNFKTNAKELFPAGILIEGTNKNIEIIDNDIHHIANYSKEGNAHGILVYGNNINPTKNVKIYNNRLHNLTLGRSESLTLSGNIDDFEIKKNLIYYNNNIGIDIAGHYGACSINGCEDFARNGLITNNTITYISSIKNPAYEGSGSSAGIYIDGAQNINVANNYVSNNDFGISVSSENKGFSSLNITLSSNYILKNTKAGLIIGGSTLNNGGAENILINNNKFYFNDQSNKGYKEVTIQNNTRNIKFFGNSYTVCRSPKYMNISDKVITDNYFKNEKVFFVFLCKK